MFQLTVHFVASRGMVASGSVCVCVIPSLSRERGGGGGGMFRKTEKNASWGVTQRTPVPNFIEIEQNLGIEKCGQKWLGKSGELGR